MSNQIDGALSNQEIDAMIKKACADVAGARAFVRGKLIEQAANYVAAMHKECGIVDDTAALDTAPSPEPASSAGQ